MEYISVNQFAEKHGVSERTVRNYCAVGKIEGAFLTGKTWNIPADAVLKKPHSTIFLISTCNLSAYIRFRMEMVVWDDCLCSGNVCRTTLHHLS